MAPSRTPARRTGLNASIRMDSEITRANMGTVAMTMATIPAGSCEMAR